ncbi:hypothetical protein [Haloprofundus salinisoli]|nr:hypothetical protein [Haloprofundus salinisoli]
MSRSTNARDGEKRTMKDVSHTAPNGVSADNVWRRGGTRDDSDRDDE